MPNDNKGSTRLVVATKEENTSFITDELQLKRLAKELSKASSQAVEVLLKCLDSKDERTRMTAATKLLEFHVSVAKEISHDQMQRLIAEIKLNRQNTKRLVDAEDDENRSTRPIVDFTTIRSVD